MNKIYQLIWSRSLKVWVICSELGKKTKSSTGVKILIGVGLSFSPTLGFSASCDVYSVPDNGFACTVISTNLTPNGDYEALNKTDIYYTTTTEGYANNFVLENQDINAENLKYGAAGVLLGARSFDSSGIRYNTLTGNNLTVVANGQNAASNAIAGLGAANGGSVFFNNVNLTFEEANVGDLNGLIAGQAYGDSGALSTNARTNLLEISGNYTFKATKTNLLNSNPVTGIRAIQNNDGRGTGVGPTAHVIIHGDYNSTITAAYGNGVYVSGQDTTSRGMPTIELLGDTTITLHGGGNSLHIGKKRGILGTRDGWGAGQLIFGQDSNVMIDQSDATGEAIVLAYDGSKLDASKTASFKVRAKSNVMRVGNDFLTNSVQSSTVEILATINNADFALSDNNSTNSLLKIDNNQGDVKFNFTGDQTKLMATDSGALLEVGQSSNIDMTVAEGKMQGLTRMGTSSSIDLKLDNHAVWQLAKQGNTTESVFTTLELNNSTLNGYDANAANWGTSNFTLTGQSVTSNSGVISLDNGKVGDILKINGNYSASGQAIVKMNTLWNSPGDALGSNSSSDELHITGMATGMTTVVPVSEHGVVNVIDGNVVQTQSIINTIPVIYVEQSGSQAFQGSAKTTGISQVQLAMRTNSSTNADEYYWTAKAKDADIYNPEVPGYVQMPIANMELGYTTLATLHERRGENQVLEWDPCDACEKDPVQSWGRVVGSHLDLDGKNRFNLNGDQFLMQLGHDFIIQENEQNHSRNHTGAFISYGRSSMDFEDRFKALNGEIVSDKYTGNGKTDAFSLGLYNTYYDHDGSYIDVVGQLSRLHNTYKTESLDSVKQKGFGTVLSIEAGRPYSLEKEQEHLQNKLGWNIEPQAQLIYQYLNLNSFDDGIRHVDQNGQHGLRGRLGLRLAHNSETEDLKTNTLYFTANVLHDFTNQKDVDIGPDSLNEKYNNTWGSLGVGVQLPVSQMGYVYADSRYEHSFSSEKRESYKGTLGFKFTW